MNIERIVSELQSYDGRELRLMEVCGTHTSSIFKSGIRSLISPKIRLISGPGCPVCVTPTAYIDQCVSYALKANHTLLTFGDMMKVPGTRSSLAQSKGEGASVELMYAPAEAVERAERNPGRIYVVAAVGFETTAPSYALAMQEAERRGIENIRFVTALKTVMPALDWICAHEEGIDGFICPGHVSVIIGSQIYGELAERYRKPFVVAGFQPEQILAVILNIVHQVENGEHRVKNLYSNAVKEHGNEKARAVLDAYFRPGPAMWRGLGIIPESGHYLRSEYQRYDGGSLGLDSDMELPPSCRCGDVIVGRINPDECPMFGRACCPENPYGPCMVSAEGACGIWHRNMERRRS